MSRKETLGPLELAGRTFHTAGTLVKVLDNGVTKSGEVIEHSLNGISKLTHTGALAVEIAANGWLEDMQTDELINRADRKIELVRALHEANERLREAGIDETITLESLNK